MSTSKKIVSAALTITTGVWMSGALFLVANAQSASTVQAQINALMAQIQQLQSQLSSTGSSTSYSFTRNLTVGSTGADVTALQKFLGMSQQTGYFGSLTKAALAKWQAANSVSPAAGYFGAITRAKVASTGGATTGTTGTTTGTGTGTTTVTAPATGLSASLASDSPAVGSLIAGSARASVLAVNLTAGNASGVTVTDLKFRKVGVISDSNISGAYLVEGGKVLAQYQSLSNGVISFSGLGLNVAAGQTRELWLQLDISSGATAGNTVGFSLASAADINSTDASGNAITEAGNFPLNGSTFTMTTVSNPSIATLAVAASSIGTQVTAGTQNNIVGAFSFTGTNSKTYLKTIKFTIIGSANKTDLRNVKLYVNGNQVGSTLASVASDGTAFFDMSSSPATINTGTNNVQVFADVMGSPSFNFQFEVLNAYDVYATDSQYNVPVTAGSSTGTQVTIKQGSITVTQDTNTPTGNIAKGQNNVTLAKYDFYAAGEAVKVKFLSFQLAFGSVTSGATLDAFIKNVHLDDDAGGQLGTTISSLTSTVTCTDVGFSAATSTAVNCFGNSSSPINYTIPANTTRVLSLKGDVQPSAGFGTITASLLASTNLNLQGLTSSQSANSGAASGGALSLASSALTVAQNSGFGTATYAANSANHKIGSFSLTASSAEGVTISNLTIKTGAYGDETQNLKVMIGSTQFGVTTPSLSASTGYSFSGTPFTVSAGGTVLVDVYADLLSNASGTLTAASRLDGCSGSGMVSYTAVSCTGTNGQNVLIAGQPALQIQADSTNPASNVLVMGSTGNTLAAFLLTETSNADSVKITDMQVKDSVAATSTTKSSFQNLCFYQGATNLGCGGSASVNGTSTDYLYSFHFASPVVIPQAGSVTLTLKGDVSSFASSGATDNATHQFKLSTSADPNNFTASQLITALGLTSNATATITTSTPNGNPMTVLRTKLSVTGTALGGTSHNRTSVDDLGTINFAADAAGALKLNSITVTFSGSGPSTSFWNTAASSTMANTVTNSTIGSCATCYVTLYDPASAISYFGVSSSSASGLLGFDLNGFTVSAGSSKSFNLRLNSSQSGVFDIGKNGISQTLSATIGSATGTTWTDAVSGGNAIGSLPTSTIPAVINSVSYPAGS